MPNEHATSTPAYAGEGQSDGLTNTTELNPASGQADGQSEGNGESNLDPAAQLAVLQERYKHSSAEGIRLAKELKEIKARLDAPPANGQADQNGNGAIQEFPPEDVGVKFYVSQGLDEVDARLRYKNDLSNHLYRVQKDQEITELRKELQNMKGTMDQGYLASDPLAAKAKAAFEGTPIGNLPVAEQVKFYKNMAEKGIVNGAVPTNGGQDRSALRMAAAGNPGGAGGRAGAPSTSDNDMLAKLNGAPNWQALQEKGACRTAADLAAWKAKWEPRKK